MSIVGLAEVNEDENLINLFCKFRLKWRDERFQWNPDDYAGIKSTVIKGGSDDAKIWEPNVLVMNSPEKPMEGFDDFLFKIDYEGNVNAQRLGKLYI